MASRPVKLKLGPRMERLYHYLQHQMVGSELVFTPSHAQQAMEQIEVVNREAVWNILRNLEKKGLIVRSRRPNEKGIIVTFPSPESFGQQSPGIKETKKISEGKKRGKDTKSVSTIADALKELLEEIDRLKSRRIKLDTEIKDKERFYNQLNDLMSGRKS
ncbi:MAG: hypothetical protein Q8P69_02100 [bacterium]|nr:hypothetical protein [bacterium]